MGMQHQLRHSLYQLLEQHKHGSYSTRHDRQQLLLLFVNDLAKAGCRLRDIHSLKEKHVRAVVSYWQRQKISNATLKNRTSALRCLAGYLHKPNIMPSNAALGIAPRSYAPKTNRAQHAPDFSRVSDRYTLISLQLQRVFGLRREESLKIRPWIADKGNRLVLAPSWCKGGRGREIPILNEEQRHWLEQAKALAGTPERSLIPPDKNYIQQRYCYDKQTAQAGLRNLHGLRHAYAQQRYKALTGWDAPINSGPTAKQLTAEQKHLDKQARMILTEELGHSREQITVTYLAR